MPQKTSSSNHKRKISHSLNYRTDINIWGTHKDDEKDLDYGLIGNHIKNQIRLKFGSMTAFCAFSNIHPKHIQKLVKGNMQGISFIDMIRICDILDLNPFDLLPDSDYEVNRYKGNRIMTLFINLNNYGRRKIIEQMEDYAKLSKYTKRKGAITERHEVQERAINVQEILSKRSINPDEFDEYDMLSYVTIEDKEDLPRAVKTKLIYNIIDDIPNSKLLSLYDRQESQDKALEKIILEEISYIDYIETFHRDRLMKTKDERKRLAQEKKESLFLKYKTEEQREQAERAIQAEKEWKRQQKIEQKKEELKKICEEKLIAQLQEKYGGNDDATDPT